MGSYLLNLTLRVKRREDGTLFATAKELPVMVTAADRPSLQRKLGEIAESIDLFLSGLSDAEQEAYLKEHGVRVERAGDEEEISMPVLVGA